MPNTVSVPSGPVRDNSPPRPTTPKLQQPTPPISQKSTYSNFPYSPPIKPPPTPKIHPSPGPVPGATPASPLTIKIPIIQNQPPGAARPVNVPPNNQVPSPVKAPMKNTVSNAPHVVPPKIVFPTTPTVVAPQASILLLFGVKC